MIVNFHPYHIVVLCCFILINKNLKYIQIRHVHEVGLLFPLKNVKATIFNFIFVLLFRVLLLSFCVFPLVDLPFPHWNHLSNFPWMLLNLASIRSHAVYPEPSRYTNFAHSTLYSTSFFPNDLLRMYTMTWWQWKHQGLSKLTV